MSRTEMIDTTAELYLDLEVCSSDSTMRWKKMPEIYNEVGGDAVVSQMS